jgi:hypothetical protein
MSLEQHTYIYMLHVTEFSCVLCYSQYFVKFSKHIHCYNVGDTFSFNRKISYH